MDFIAALSAAWRSNGAAAVALAYILLPLFFVIWLAFFRQEIPSFPPEGYSLKWFARHSRQRQVRQRVSRSASRSPWLRPSIGLALGVPAAVCLARSAFAGRGPLTNLLLMPLIVPGIVLGIAIYVFHVETEIATRLPILGSLRRPGRRPRR